MNDLELKVTIITICYNPGPILERAIKSVLHQTYPHIEYLIIDGGSTDDTLPLIKKYETKLDQWISEPDEGIGDAWNKGIALSTGSVIGFLNADDYFQPDSVEKAVANFSHHNSLITYGITKFYDKEGSYLGINKKVFNPKMIYLGFGFTHTSCFVAKSVYDTVGSFNKNIKIAVDTDWLLRAVAKHISFKRAQNVVHMQRDGVSAQHPIKAFLEYAFLLKKYGYQRLCIWLAMTVMIPYLALRKMIGEKATGKSITQIRYLVMATINTLYNWLPFFSVKKGFIGIFRIAIGEKSYIHTPVTFFHLGHFQMGRNSTVNFGCLLDNRIGIEIGNNVSIAHHCKIYTFGHDFDDPHFITQGKKVIIEDDVCLFAGVIVYPGVTIGRGAVIFPGTVVVKDVKPFSVMGGNPAKKIRDRNPEISYEIDHGLWFAT